jgi:CDP-diacylglycerol--glycerol-3-phosphate 3-phosphatidyltransferase
VAWTIPNILTVSRIALAPVIALLPFIEGYGPKLIAFGVFLVAAISDIFDGVLARRWKQVSDLGKELDPLADKLLLFATLIPIYWITTYRMREYGIPWWGSMPLWAAVLLVGREVFMTAFRARARRRGVVIAAAGPGKVKTMVQDTFIGATIAWFAWTDLATAFGWRRNWLGAWWDSFHGWFVAVTLGIALILTVYSMAVYLYRYRALLRSAPAGPARPDGH